MTKQWIQTRLDKKITYFKHKAILNKKYIDRRIDIIDKYASTYYLDRNELYGILLLEYLNRGSWITRNTERVFVSLFTRSAINLDLSIGIAQIKISTAKKFYPSSDFKTLAKKLLIDEFNIHLCAQIMNKYYLSPQKNNKLLGLVKQYTTGNKNAKENLSIYIYYKLLKWIIEEQYFKS
ncbi:hypothetical protein [Oceanobacillus profundus]|uniref:hypothetical protein n=1 Tax=Oceanobacillus TaxID=182709 RepID=UPI0026E3DF91|nr:hypothetical protein [Oceanobacillus profundus]MDO6448995.1 hypothetical protein [Oceanobacillus profundus]